MVLAPSIAALLPADLALEVEAQARAVGCEPAALVIEMVRGMLALRAHCEVSRPDIDVTALVDDAWQQMGKRTRSR